METTIMGLYRVQGLRVWSLGFMGFGVEGLGFRVQSLEFRVQV